MGQGSGLEGFYGSGVWIRGALWVRGLNRGVSLYSTMSPYIRILWALVCPITFVPHKMCWIKQVLDKPG